MFYDDPFHSISDGAEQREGAHGKVEGTGGVPLFHARFTPTNEVPMPEKGGTPAISPHVIPKQLGHPRRDSVVCALTLFRIEGIDEVKCLHGLASVECTLRTFCPNLTTAGNSDSQLDVPWMAQPRD